MPLRVHTPLLLRWISPILSFYLVGVIQGQNLVPNWSFEEYTECPTGLSGGVLSCTEWINPTGGTSDYFHTCGAGGAGVPANVFGNQDAHTGNAYCGGYYYGGNQLSDYREYIQVRLTEPLTEGLTYYVSLWYSVADGGPYSCPSNQLGVHLSVEQILQPWNVAVMDLDPQIELTSGLMTNTTSWEQLSACFVSLGGEEYLTIGNFYNDAQTDADPACAFGGYTYLYIDDVEVIENDEPPGVIDFDLGPEIETCEDALLDPGLGGGYDYIWSDGSHDPTLTATESGWYYVTVTSGCDFGLDSVEVTILGSPPPVDLGAPELEICPGDEIAFELDPDFGTYTWQDGSTGSSYTITGPGTYSVTLDDGCDESTDMVEVIELSLPEPFTLGNDTILCEGAELELELDPDLGMFEWQDGTSGNSIDVDMPGTYSLTISNVCGEVTDEIEVAYLEDLTIAFPDDFIIACPGDVLIFEFDPELGDYLWQDGSTEATYEVTEEGTYSVQVSDMCSSDFDEVFVEFPEQPVVDLGSDLILCPAQLPYFINVSNVDHVDDYFWHDGFEGAVYEVTTTGVYAITVSNTCFEDSDEIEIIVEDAAPIVELPEDVTLCSGETMILDAGGIPGAYIWQDGSTLDLFTVTTAGIYSVTVTNACGTGSDQISVSYDPPLPSFDLGPDIGLCPGEEILLQVNIPGVTYLWHDGSTGNSFNVSSPGTVMLTISNDCTSLSDTLSASIDGTPPALTLMDTASICQGESTILDASIGGVSYLWSTGAQSQTITVSTPGNYGLTVTNACGSAEDSTIVVNEGIAPVADLGPDLDLCPGNTVVLYAQAGSNDILWNTGSAADTLLVAIPGVISVEISNSCGSAFDTLVVNGLEPVPVLSLGPDTMLCPGESWLIDPAPGDVEYLWQDGSVADGYLVSGPGLIWLEVSNSCGSTTDTLFVGYYPDAPSFSLGKDASLCPGEQIILDPGIADVTYAWQDGSTGSSYVVTSPGTYSVILQSDCWQIGDTIQVHEDSAGPMVNLGNDTTVCEGEIVIVESGILGVDYLWHDGSQGSSYTASFTEEVILSVINACGADADTIQVTVSGMGPVVSLGADTLLCSGTTINLSPVIEGSATSLLWQDGSSGQSFLVNTGGHYSVIATNDCGESIADIRIDEIHAPGEFSLGKDTILCPGEQIALDAPVTADEILWSTGSTDPSVSAMTGEIWLHIINVCGIAADTVSIAENTDVPEAFLAPQNFCHGDSVILDVTQPFEAEYLWNTGITQSSLVVSASGTYSVTVTSECADVIASSQVVVEECVAVPVQSLYIPNVFSPNNDGINDFFLPLFRLPEQVTDFQMSIYDRWGEVLFRTTDLSSGWDGTASNELLNPGVFVYTIQWRSTVNPNHTEQLEIEHGDVTLIR